jgi:putative intracellular protease/amidase
VVLPNFEGPRLLIVPGGPRSEEVVKDPGLLDDLLALGAEKPIASVCTGATILKAANLLAGRRVTTHHNARKELQNVATVVEDRVGEDGLITTADAVTASIMAIRTFSGRRFHGSDKNVPKPRKNFDKRRVPQAGPGGDRSPRG